MVNGPWLLQAFLLESMRDVFINTCTGVNVFRLHVKFTCIFGAGALHQCVGTAASYAGPILVAQLLERGGWDVVLLSVCL